jgi:hypothetical protein
MNSSYPSATKIFLLLFILFVYSGLFLFSYQITELPSYEKVPLMDGNQYLKMYHYFNGSISTYHINFPFNSRVLYMWIASLFPDVSNPVEIFVLLNYLFGLATLLLLFQCWEKLSIPSSHSLFLIAYLCLHWSGLIHQYMVDPVGVDVPYLFCLILLLYMMIIGNFRYLFVLAIAGTAIKEAIIPFLALLLLIKLFESKTIFLEGKKIQVQLSNVNSTIKQIVLAILASIVCKMIINFYFPAEQNGWKHNSIATIFQCLKIIALDPIQLLYWITGMFLFFGPLFYPFVKNMSVSKINTQYGGLFMFTLLGLILAIIGGGDHTRIAFLAFPFFFTCVLLSWGKKTDPAEWIIYSATLFYLTKSWKKLPTPTSNWETFSYWYPEYSTWKLFIPELLMGIIAIIILYFYPRMNKKIQTY